MKLIEDMANVKQDGSLTLDGDYLSAIGLGPGDEINIAFMANGEGTNIFAEFLISPAYDGVDSDANHIFIPHELLQRACILPYSDINIACVDGALVIYQSEGFDPTELSNVLDSLHFASDFLHNIAPDHLDDCAPPKGGRTLL